MRLSVCNQARPISRNYAYINMSFLLAAAVVFLPLLSNAQVPAPASTTPHSIEAVSFVAESSIGLPYTATAEWPYLKTPTATPAPIARFKTGYTYSGYTIQVTGLSSTSHTPQRRTNGLWMFAAKGAAVGAFAGFIIAAAATPKDPPNSLLGENWTKFTNGMTGLVIGLPVGAVTGLIIGESKREKQVQSTAF